MGGWRPTKLPQCALSAWKTKFVYKKQNHDNEEAPVSRRLCLRGERTWGETLD